MTMMDGVMTIKFESALETNKGVPKTMDQLMNIANKDRVGYEVFNGFVKPYYDFDYNYKNEQETLKNRDEDVKKSIDACRAMFPLGNLKIFVSHGDLKNSIHIIVCDVGYAKCGKNVPVIELSDQSVYKNTGKKQKFRLPYFRKTRDDNRVFKLLVDGKTLEFDYAMDMGEKFEDWCISTINGDLMWDDVAINDIEIKGDIKKNDDVIEGKEIPNEYQKYIDLFREKCPNVYNVNTFRDFKAKENAGVVLNFDRHVKPSHCGMIGGKTHTDNTNAIYVFQNGTVLLSCMKCCHKDRGIDKCKYIFLQGEDFEKTERFALNDFKSDSTVMFNEKYCADIELFTDSILKPEIKLIAVKSNMNTGKTYAVAKKINECVAVDSKVKAGVLSSRVSLAKKYGTDFKGFVIYFDKKDSKIDDDRWICQLDSLWRINAVELDVLIIDEVVQARQHMTSSTYMGQHNFNANRASLAYLIRKAKQVIIMDANVSNRDMVWINSLRNEPYEDLEIVKIMNTYVGNTFDIRTTTTQQIIRLINADIVNKRKFVLAHNGAVDRQTTMYNLFVKTNPGVKILCINGDSIKEDDVKKALDNPDEQFGLYDGIIYSPTVQSGLSYEQNDVFTNIYGIFGNWSNSSSDVCQMLRRIRNPISNMFIVNICEMPCEKACHTSVEAVNQYLRHSREHVVAGKRDADIQDMIKRMPFAYNDLGEIKFTNSSIYNETVYNMAERNYDKRNFKRRFKQQQLSYGNTVEPYECDEKKRIVDDRKTKSELHVVNTERRKYEAEELVDAVDIDEAEAIIMKKRLKEDPLSVNNDERNAYKKYMLNKFYKQQSNYNVMEPLITLVMAINWYMTYNTARMKHLYRTLSLYYKKNQSLELSLEDIRKNEVNRDVNFRTGAENNTVDNEDVIVKSLQSATYFNYAKHKILLRWMRYFGYQTFFSTETITREKTIEGIDKCLNSMTEAEFSILGKSKKKYFAIRVLDKNHKNYIKTALKFINAPLKDEFGVAIRRTGDDVFCLDNETWVVLHNAGIAHFEDPYEEHGDIEPHFNAPILGATRQQNIEIIDEINDIETVDDFAEHIHPVELNMNILIGMVC